MKRFPLAFVARLAGFAALLSVGGCPLQIMDQNAYQTGKVLGPGATRLSASTLLYYPTHASVDVGLGKGWEVGAGGGKMLGSWDWIGGLSATHSLYSSQRLFSSAQLQAEMATGSGRLHPLGRITTGVAVSYWPSEEFGICAPLRLSMLFTSPATFPYTQRVWNDSLGRYVRVPGERAFRGLRDPALTTGLGLAYEPGRVYWRLAVNLPVLGPNVQEDSVAKGLELLPYLGFQFGVRLF